MRKPYTKPMTPTEIAATTDSDLDFTDIPELDETFWQNAQLVEPDRTQPVTLRIKKSVLDAYKAQGKGYQTRMNAVLETYANTSRRCATTDNAVTLSQLGVTPAASGLRHTAMLADYDARSIAEIMGLAPRQAAPPTPATIEHTVEQGLPRAALRHLAQRLAGTDPTRIPRLEWGIVPKTTLDHRETRLSPEESERTERAARLFVHATRALGTEAEARDFMTIPHPMLGGKTPLEAARTDLATRRAEHILHALEYGLAL